jgi:1-acyl-sn-glycerol-3-phosphate acyltransferase
MSQLDASTGTKMFAKEAPTTSHISPWLASLVYPLGRYLVVPNYFGQIEIVGQENIPKTGPVIIAPTHRARWDAILIPYATGRGVTGRDLRFMVSLNEVNKGLQGWFIRRLGGFGVDPEHPAIASLRHGVELLQQGEVLVIFPEGDIYRDGDLHPLKPGLARLALCAEASHPGLGIQVVPVGVRYSQTFPRWGSDVSIRIGLPLKVADYDTRAVKQSAKQLTLALEKALRETSVCCLDRMRERA